MACQIQSCKQMLGTIFLLFRTPTTTTMDSFLPWLELWYNTTYQSSTGMSTFQIFYGRLLSKLSSYPAGSSPVNEVDQSLKIRDNSLKLLKDNLAVAQNRMKQYANQSCREISF